MCEAKQVTVKDVLFTLKNIAIELVQALGFKRDIPTCKRIQDVEDCSSKADYVRTFVAERATIDGGYSFDEPVHEFKSRMMSYTACLWRADREHTTIVMNDDMYEFRVHVTKANREDVYKADIYLSPYTKLSHKKVRNIGR